MCCSEIMALVLTGVIEKLTVSSIIACIGKAAANKTFGMLTETLLHKIIGKEKLADELSEIQKQLTNIHITLTSTVTEMKWEISNEIFTKAEMNINNKFKLLQYFLSIDSKHAEEDDKKQLSEFRDGILNANTGIFHDLSYIHQMLIGHPITHPGKAGLLKMWSDNIYDTMLDIPMSAKKYEDDTMEYLHNVAVLQFMGSLLIMHARSNSTFGIHLLNEIQKNLESQKDLMTKMLPPATTHLTQPKTSDLFVLRPLGQLRVLYGPPVGEKEYDHALRLRERQNNNEDEEWIFEQSPTFDKDGSLLISENSKKITGHSCGYIKLTDNQPYCNAERAEATSFYIMPVRSEPDRMLIYICASENSYESFLHVDESGISYGQKRSLFVMTPTFHNAN